MPVVFHVEHEQIGLSGDRAGAVPAGTAHGLTPRRIAAILARQVFARDLVCPNCTWTGHEADLLVVTPSLHLIDCEVKVDRADLKNDRHKEKWWIRPAWRERGERNRGHRRDWPPRVWKHYYAMPAGVLPPEGPGRRDLLAALPQASGVLELEELEIGRNTTSGPAVRVTTLRRARPNRDAHRIEAGDAVCIARLASLRMWDAIMNKQPQWPAGAARVELRHR
jgi:hypothetical protein